MQRIDPSSVEIAVGDIVFAGRSKGAVSLALWLGQLLRHGDDSPFTIWGHCAIVVQSEGNSIWIAEADKSGVRFIGIRQRFPNGRGTYAVLHTGTHLGERDRRHMLEFLSATSEVKHIYNFRTHVARVIFCLTLGKLCLQKAGTTICSGLVCEAFARTGVVWKYPPYAMTPADIAEHYDFRYTEGI